MLEMSDFPIVDAIKLLAGFGIEAAYIVPTPTGMDKSIMDAHKGVRYFLKSHGIHDFDLQGQGSDENGVKLPIVLLTPDHAIEREISLYRPKSKSGDPRLWVNVRGFAQPYNLLCLVDVKGKGLALLNMSDPQTVASLSEPGSEIYKFLNSNVRSSVAERLLGELRAVHARGFIASERTGDTAVGHTLETALGIQENSSKQPDFYGEIELKSQRLGDKSKVLRSTLLSRVPSWIESPMSEKDILKNFGYPDKKTGRKRLYVTLKNSPNRQGLYLVENESLDQIENQFLSENGQELVALWHLADLKNDLSNKHSETFWIKAEAVMGEDGHEKFKYVRAIHTKKPLVANFGPLVNSGVITMDFTLSTKEDGQVRNHGYLFKIHPKNLNLLIPNVGDYDLSLNL